MKTPQVVAIVCMAGGLVVAAGSPSHAQHSSGGTAPGVTENQGQGASKGTQGVPGSGWNAQKGGGGSGSQMGAGSGTGSGSMSGEANSPESSKGTGYGLESGSHSEKDTRSGQSQGSGRRYGVWRLRRRHGFRQFGVRWERRQIERGETSPGGRRRSRILPL